MADDFGLESQLTTLKSVKHLAVGTLSKTQSWSDQTFVWCNMYKNGNWQLLVRSKPSASAFCSLFSKFMYLQYEHSSGYHVGTSAPL